MVSQKPIQQNYNEPLDPVDGIPKLGILPGGEGINGQVGL
jgi:hypothetical protein